jgi:hypothetical protein
MIYYHNHPEYRIGDEIQTTALIKYLKTKGHEIYYKDSNPFVSAIELFPDDLVVFTSENFFNYEIFEPYNIWFWSVMLREKGIYTELNHQYEESKIKFDVVFTPVLSPTYNLERAIKPESALSMLNMLTNQYDKVRMIIDKNKKHLFKEIENNNIIYSDDIYETFEYIKCSKIFLGTDTGTTHYAGALKHPRMVLALPDETPIQNNVRWHRDLIAERCNEPEMLNIEVNSLPCCNPKQFRVVQIENNEMPIKKIMRAMNNL